MTVKSIISIDVVSQEFDKFRDTFDKYQQQLKGTQSAWNNIASSQSKMSFQTNSYLKALLTGKQYVRESADSTRDQTKHLISSDKLWTSISKSTKSVASSILGATRSLLSWTGILSGIGGLLGAGGLWGIDRIASRVSDQRQSALGRGMSIGGQSAFRTYFERLGNPDQFLDMVNQIETDPRQWSSYALGAAKTGNADRDSISLLKAMRARALATPTSQLGLLDTQYGTSVGEEYWRRLKDTPAEEFNKLIQQYQANQGQMQVPNAGAWQGLKTQMGSNWNKVGAAFDTRLGDLAPNLSKLSDSFTKLAIAVINSPEIERGLNALGKWMDNVATTVGSPGFIHKVEDFIFVFGEGVSKFIDGIERVAAAIEKIASYLPGYDGGSSAKAGKGRFLDQLSTLESNSNLPKGLLTYQWGKESGGTMNPSDNKGHVGAFQFDPKTADWLNKRNHTHLDPRNAGQASVLAAYYDDYLSQRYGGDTAKIIAAWNWGSGDARHPRFDALMAKHPKDWGKYLPQETKNYIAGAPASLNAHAPGITITIDNPAGANVHVSSSQLKP